MGEGGVIPAADAVGAGRRAGRSADRAEVCVIACAEAFRGDGEILASAIGLVPAIAVRLARHTFEPGLLLTDGEAHIVEGTWAVGTPAPGPVESWLPYRTVFDVVWRGDRHVMMTPSQIDAFGNANISAIGSHAKPRAQLLGARGAPGNTVNHPTSYWVPRHGLRVFTLTVDSVAGVGWDSAAKAGPAATRYMALRRVVSNLASFDWDPVSHRMRLLSVHPGVTVDEVVAATGFDLVIGDGVPATREPTAEELRLIREVIDPSGARYREVPA
jgi:acyl CoA:acetate/3-ketoacid CoA transferase beta subunit